jgi:hypothetical protein
VSNSAIAVTCILLAATILAALFVHGLIRKRREDEEAEDREARELSVKMQDALAERFYLAVNKAADEFSGTGKLLVGRIISGRDMSQMDIIKISHSTDKDSPGDTVCEVAICLGATPDAVMFIFPNGSRSSYPTGNEKQEAETIQRLCSYVSSFKPQAKSLV